MIAASSVQPMLRRIVAWDGFLAHRLHLRDSCTRRTNAAAPARQAPAPPLHASGRDDDNPTAPRRRSRPQPPPKHQQLSPAASAALAAAAAALAADYDNKNKGKAARNPPAVVQSSPSTPSSARKAPAGGRGSVRGLSTGRPLGPKGKGGSRDAPAQDAASAEPQRLSKVLAAAGVASRRACETLIEAGEVKVNGIVVKQQGVTVNPMKDKVSVRDKAVVLGQPKLYYFMVNKPKGFICSNAENEERQGKRVVDILQPWVDDWSQRQLDKKRLPPRFFTVGRLDVASYGLILVTNDGQWAQSVIHPSSDITKEYLVTVNKAVHRNSMKAMLAGTEVEGVHVAPLEVSTLENNTKLRIVIKEGKKHEVRELVIAAGLEVVSLKRVRIGGLRVPSSLGLGAYKQMSLREIKAVTDLSHQEQLRRNAWGSATLLMLKEEQEQR